MTYTRHQKNKHMNLDKCISVYLNSSLEAVFFSLNGRCTTQRANRATRTPAPCAEHVKKTLNKLAA